jgi:hypothetical protein
MTCQSCLWWAPNSKHHPEGEPVRWCRQHKRETDDGFSCDQFMGPEATEANVPQHTPEGIDMPLDPVPVPGPVHILIVTYEKDLPWLHYCLRSIERFTKGFQGVTVAYPAHSGEAFHKATEDFDVELFPYHEVKGKGMVQHMAMMASADQIVPASTAFVMHMDSDVCFVKESEPGHYFTAGKPQYLYRTYASLLTQDAEPVRDCHQWKTPTEQQLGFEVEDYTMVRHPTVFPIGFYQPYRQHVEKVQGMGFLKYMVSGRNQFPQDRMDFTAMGAFSRKTMRSEFAWIDITTGHYPKDRIVTHWSHGGITPKIRQDLERFLA